MNPIIKTCHFGVAQLNQHPIGNDNMPSRFPAAASKPQRPHPKVAILYFPRCNNDPNFGTERISFNSRAWEMTT